MMRFDDKMIEGLNTILEEAALSEIMPRFRKLDTGDIRQKTSASDLVTEADVNAERVITAELRRRFPDALIVGEEACSEDESLLDGLADAELAFTIDPVDGTFNFASGMPIFGVMLAVVQRGETVAGLIHDPIGKDTLLASRGAGAWVRRGEGDRTRVKVAERATFDQMTGALSWQYFGAEDRLKLAVNQTRCLASFNYRAAAAEYRMLATGCCHFVVYGHLMPWDHLPGVLICEEAGGHVAHLDGKPYRAGRTDGGILCATDPDSWQMLRRELWA